MTGLRFLLYPFSILYDGVTGLRNYGFDKGWINATSFEIPIIAVGNLSTGGTGKSPMVEYLVRQHAGHKIAVLSRGYGRATKGYLEVFESSKATEVGDEPLQFKLKFRDQLIVSVCEKRVDGIKRLLEDHDLDLIILDDAFQHRYVKASHYVLLTHYSQPYFNDALLPAGNLRESRAGADRAQSIVVTKCPDGLTEAEMISINERIKPKAYQKVYFSKISYSDHAIGQHHELDLSSLKGKDVKVITGIAKPEYFIRFLERFVIIQHLKFPDHYNFRASDLDGLQKDDIILTTEKDYVRLKEFNLENLYYVGITTVFIGEEPQINISGN
ncbi:tetraacyldisaccharide 4'-kinase [Nonlabens agnitus]|uniref:Tetraacyldisaccharide 4'-kinase n=1 Tax=Nonlabens agnitus TaxID=870484 RepID=A0A2S9WQE1_9FLAO|nr:tetraacyldisaccharide 4'-kinase [Nonlabens agnitus]PRP65691.1 tetraacyldisaccharide 4'-kinase [Nonlabens agnitus]